MNKTKSLLLGTALLSVAGVGYLTFNKKEAVYTADNNEISDKSYHGAQEWLFERRKNPATGRVDLADITKAKKEFDQVKKTSTRSLGLEWTERGPDNIGGRTRVIEFDKDNPSIMFTGGVGGGVFYTTTGGSSWWKIDNMDELDNIAVNSMVQDNDGYLYFGTGEGFYQNTGDGTGGFEGAGIYKSDQPVASYSNLSEMTFSKLESTWEPTVRAAFVNVNRLECQRSTGRIYAATARGVFMTSNGGETWEKAYTDMLIQNSFSFDVEIDAQNGVYTTAGQIIAYSPSGDQNTFEMITAESLSIESGRRLELETADSDPNYIYVAEIAGDESLRAVHRSTDKGATWEIIGQGNTEVFSPMGTPGAQMQGFFDLALAVVPDNKEKIILGGVELWSWESTVGWERVASTFQFAGSPVYVHADVHYLAFHPNNPDKAYIASDGGIARTDDEFETYSTLNRGYNVTQFYSIAYDKDGNIMGGTQDNSNQYLQRGDMSSKEMYSGDGAYTAISHLNPDALFMSSQYGNVGRSSNRGISISRGESFLEGIPGYDNINASFGNFITPFRLWETKEYEHSIDTIQHIVANDITPADSAGTVTIEVNSVNVSTARFEVEITEALSAGDTIDVIDPVQSKFYIGVNNGVYMTRDALNFSRTSEWFHIADEGSGVGVIECASNGDIIYYADNAGNAYRISNLTQVVDTASIDSAEVTQILSGVGSITGIAIDPNDEEHVIITVGGYGSGNKVYESTEAATTTGTSSFSVIDGNLPSMPVYDALIDYEDPNKILLATEFGIFSKSGGTNWSADNNGMAPVPTFMLVQQTRIDAGNVGMVYAATHGRGFFETATLVGMDDSEEESNAKVAQFEEINLFPNPTADFAVISLNVNRAQNATVEVYGVNGSLVKRFTKDLNANENQVQIDLRDLSNGIYMVNLISEEARYSGQVIKQ